MWFKTEADCRRYLMGLRWPGGLICPKCQGDSFWNVRRAIYRCTKCRKEINLVTGTLFQDSNLTLLKWFDLIWKTAWSSKSESIGSLDKYSGLNMSASTIWRCLGKLHAVMVTPDKWKLTGEIEFSKTTLRVRGGGLHEVLMLVQRRSTRRGQIRLALAGRDVSRSAERFVEVNTDPHDTIVTTEWLQSTTSVGQKCQLRITDEADLKGCRRVEKDLKDQFIARHKGAVRAINLAAYLDNFAFRFNSGKVKNRGAVFYQILIKAAPRSPRYK